MDEELKFILGFHVSDPGVEVIHLANASCGFGTMMRAVWFPVQAARAELRTSVAFAGEKSSLDVMSQTRRTM